VPSQLGPYDVGPKIGGGGMATVYVGRRRKASHVERDVDEGSDVVAIKVIRDELADDTHYVHMFLDEAKVLSRLSHPDIIVTRDFGIAEDVRFIAMELLLGRSLIDVFERAKETDVRMPLDLAELIALRVARALDYAHGLQVIHRDVNPTNIFLTYDGRVKLIDFGLAKSVGRLAKSGEGIVKGKIPYLSPEQIDEKPFDHRADIYALGATLWEITAGRRLFKRATDVETIQAIRAQDIPDPRTFVDGLYPDALWTIVRRALERDPAARYPTAEAMAQDLAALLDKHGRKTDMSVVLASWLEELFPGERAKQEAWLAKVSAVHVPTTMAPPAPVAEVPAPESAPVSAGNVEAKATEQTGTLAAPPRPTSTQSERHPFKALLALAATFGFFALLVVVFQRC
jgi:serine/threonine protein kinase